MDDTTRSDCESEIRPHDGIPRDLGIALSGGGHRASLFALGALLYLADCRANERVATVCSVSGGSITNAFIAQECDFGTVCSKEFDEVAARLVKRITTERIVSLSSWFVRGYLALLFVGPALVWLVLSGLLGWTSPLEPPAAASLILTFGSLLLSRGTVVAWLLGRAFFLDAQGRPSRLGSLRNKTVGHVLCATDLAAAAPFYFLCGNEWAAYSPRYGFARARDLKLCTAVRASAALPFGIPPKLLSRSSLDWAADFKPQPIPLEAGEVLVLPAMERPLRFLFLADGGVWNNLGTQYFERDRALGIPFAAAKPASRPNADPGKLIVIDGGSGVPPLKASWELLIPIWAELKALSRVLSLLYANTVRPRMQRLGDAKRAFWRWGDMFDRDWDIPTTGISLANQDKPQSGRIHMGLQFPETEHARAVLSRSTELDHYRAGLPKIICPTLAGFPATGELQSFCAKEGTHLSIVGRTRAAALLVSGYLLMMEEMHVAYGTPLVQPFPDEQRFTKLLSA